MVKMGNNVPLSIQIKQFIKKIQDQKAQEQSIMDSLEIYDQYINNNKAQRVIQSYQKSGMKIPKTPEPSEKDQTHEGSTSTTKDNAYSLACLLFFIMNI